MLKKGVLSTAEKFYIESHSGLDSEQIAKSLNRNTETVDKYLKKLKSQQKKEAEPIKVEEPKEKVLDKGKTSKLIGRNNKGSVVMTPAASELGDSNRKVKIGKNLENAIFRPMGEK